MHHFGIFYVFLLQIILFAQPAASQLDKDRILTAFVDSGLLPKSDAFKFGYSAAQPVKHCSTIKYPLEPITFVIDICLDKSSKELGAKLKVGDVDLGQAKGTFDAGVLISFDHETYLTGHHRFYVKGNELWLRYSNVIHGKNDNGDFKLRSLSSIYSEDSGAPKPRPKGNASKPLISSEDLGAPNPGPKEEEPNLKPGPKEEEPKPKPKKDVPKSKPKGKAFMVKPKGNVLKVKPKGNAFIVKAKPQAKVVLRVQ